MARTRTNYLVTDLRREAKRARTVLANVGKVTIQVDDPWIAEALGRLAQAISDLETAANKFERRGLDYPGRNPETLESYGQASRQAFSRSQAREKALATGTEDGPDLIRYLLANDLLDGRLQS